jgi:Na+/melibiose symporter-like transporter
MLFITTALHLPIVLRLLGVLPHNGGSGLLLLVAVFFMLGGIAGGIAITTASSMMADVSQEFEYQSGRPQQGVLFSAISLSQQLGSGVGHTFAGVGLSLIGFPTQAKDVSAVDPTLITSLGLFYLTTAIVRLAGIYAYTRYDLTQARHQKKQVSQLS